MAPSLNLTLGETFNAFISYGLRDVGRLSGEHNDPATITVSTIQSLHKYPKLDKVKVLIVDEVRLAFLLLL